MKIAIGIGVNEFRNRVYAYFYKGVKKHAETLL